MGMQLFGGQSCNVNADAKIWIRWKYGLKCGICWKNIFPSINYHWDLFSTLSDLKQGNKSVVQYTEQFNLVQARCDLDELEDIVALQYSHGLKLDIWHVLAFEHFDIVAEVVQHAIKVEEIANQSQNHWHQIQVTDQNQARNQCQIIDLFSLSKKGSFDVPMSIVTFECYSTCDKWTRDWRASWQARIFWAFDKINRKGRQQCDGYRGCWNWMWTSGESKMLRTKSTPIVEKKWLRNLSFGRQCEWAIVSLQYCYWSGKLWQHCTYALVDRL